MEFTPDVRFGKWKRLLFYLDDNYDHLVSKLIGLAREVGPDPCGRCFDAEPLVDFAVSTGKWYGSADYIYRQYTYHLIRKFEGLPLSDIDLLMSEFIVI